MGDTEPSSPPPLGDAARAVYGAAREFAGASGGAAASLRRLLLADLALAGTAAAHAAIALLGAALLAATAWLLLTALAAWALYRAGLGWGWALALPALVDLLLAAIAAWWALATLRLANLKESRRAIVAFRDDVGTLMRMADRPAAAPGPAGPAEPRP